MYVVSWHTAWHDYQEGYIHDQGWLDFDNIEEAQEYYYEVFSRYKNNTELQIYLTKTIKFDQR